jgi:hypothetical protein
MIFRAYLNLYDYLSVHVCLLRSLRTFSWRSERARERGRRRWVREFDAEDPDCQQEFAEEADEGKSSLSPLMHVDPIFKHNPKKPF